MRKLIKLSLVLSLFAVSYLSVDAKGTINKVDTPYEIVSIIYDAETLTCTVTATVNVAGTGVSISSTKETCAEAVKDVVAGVKAVLAMM